MPRLRACFTDRQHPQRGYTSMKVTGSIHGRQRPARARGRPAGDDRAWRTDARGVGAAPVSRPFVRIAGCGKYLPERIMPNSELAQVVDTSDEWIRART